MARHLKRVADIGLTAVSIEGALISPDQVVAIAATTPDQKVAADYGCPKGTNLRGRDHPLFSDRPSPLAGLCQASGAQRGSNDRVREKPP